MAKVIDSNHLDDKDQCTCTKRLAPEEPSINDFSDAFLVALDAVRDMKKDQKH